MVNEAEMESLFFSPCSSSFEYFIRWVYFAKAQLNCVAFPEVRFIKFSISAPVVRVGHTSEWQVL